MRAIILSHQYLDPGHRGKLRALAGLGAGLTVAVPGGSASEEAGVRYAPIPATGNSDPSAGLTWSRRAVRRLLSDVRPDLLQLEEEPGTRAAATASAEAVRLGIPVVLFSWESLPRRRGFWEGRRARHSFRAAAGGIGGNTLATELLRQELDRLPVATVAQFGVEPPPLLVRPGHAELAIGYVGRLLPERGVADLLRACATIMGPWTLTIAGTGPEQESLEALAQRLGLASRIRWLGGVDRTAIAALWPQLDCLAFPSRPSATWAERWSPVLVDAMAHGVVPLVTSGGGLTGVVEGAGLVADGVEAMGEALQALRAFPEERAHRGAMVRQRVLDRYIDTAVARDTMALWREVLAARAPLNRSA